VVTALLLVAVLSAPAAQPAAAQSDCSTTVVHDSFKTNPTAVEALANGTEVRSTENNTQVTIAESNRFYNLDFSNPNAYCVEYIVEISPNAIPTTSIPGNIKSNDGQHTAEWESVGDWEQDETFTRVTVTLPASTSASFSPSADRVSVLNWADSQKRESTGIIDNFTSGLSDEEENSGLEQREYILDPDESTEINVELTRENSSERVDEWQAQYRTSDNGDWKPITQDAEDPVFYQERGQDGDTIRFTFNDPNGQVRFIAEPTRAEKLEYESDSYFTSWEDLGSLLPL